MLLFKLTAVWLYPGRVEVIVDGVVNTVLITTFAKIAGLNSEFFQTTMDLISCWVFDALINLLNDYFLIDILGQTFVYFYEKHLAFVEKSIKNLKRTMMIFTYFLYVTFVLLFVICYYLRNLPMTPFWYPIDTTTSNGFLIGYIHFVVFMASFSTTVPIINTLISGFMSIASMNFELLAFECEMLLIKGIHVLFFNSN